MKILFTGGGTAGRCEPGLGRGRLYQKPAAPGRYPLCRGRRQLQKSGWSKAGGLPIVYIPAGRAFPCKLNWKGIRQNVDALSKAAKASRRARERSRANFSPTWCWAQAGYASYPAVQAAVRQGIRLFRHLLEVNAARQVWWSKRMSRKVDCVFTSFAETGPQLPGAKKVVLAGSPVRQEIVQRPARWAQTAAVWPRGRPNGSLVLG